MQRLARFANLGALGNEAQAIEVDVGAAQDRDERLIVRALTFHPRLHASDRERAGGLHDRARVVEDVLDRRADLVVGHAQHFVHGLPHDLERPLADLAHRDAVREDADVIELHAPAVRERSVHRVGLERLDADHLHIGPQRLDVAGDTGNQTAAADRHEHRRQLILAVTNNLGADRPLPCDDQRIVEGMDERHAGLRHERVAVRLGLVVAVARQHHLGAHRLHRIHLDPRRRLRHDDDRAQTEPLRRERHALRVIAGAGGDDTARPLPVRQMRNLVVGAAQLEAEDRLQVLALEQDFVVETLGQAWRLVERRLPRHVVDATGEHVAKKLGEFGGDEHRPIVSAAFT